jgi:hypothetical protein
MWLMLCVAFLADAAVPRLAVAGPDVLAAYGDRVFVSADRGVTWTAAGDLGGHAAQDVRGSATTWVAMTDALDGGRAFVSVHRGVHWQERDAPQADCGLALATDGRMFECASATGEVQIRPTQGSGATGADRSEPWHRSCWGSLPPGWR